MEVGLLPGIEEDNGSQFPPDNGARIRPPDFGGEFPVGDDFVDEPRVRHNVYPASDSENDEDEVGTDDVVKPERHGEELLEVGQVFYESEHIKAAVLDHALKHGRNIRQNRYDETKLGFCCVGGNCKWRLWCAIAAHGTKWEVRSYIDRHDCVPNGACELLKIPVIANLFEDKIRDEPRYYMPMKIQEIIKTKYKINVSRINVRRQETLL